MGKVIYLLVVDDLENATLSRYKFPYSFQLQTLFSLSNGASFKAFEEDELTEEQTFSFATILVGLCVFSVRDMKETHTLYDTAVTEGLFLRNKVNIVDKTDEIVNIFYVKLKDSSC